MATSRQTKLQRIAALLAEVTCKVDSLAEKELDWAGDDLEANSNSLTFELGDIKTELENLVERASEPDPNKRTYNKATADKILDLKAAYDHTIQKYEDLQPKFRKAHELSHAASATASKPSAEPVNERNSIDSVIAGSDPSSSNVPKLDDDKEAGSAQSTVKQPGDEQNSEPLEALGTTGNPNFAGFSTPPVRSVTSKQGATSDDSLHVGEAVQPRAAIAHTPAEPIGRQIDNTDLSPAAIPSRLQPTSSGSDSASAEQQATQAAESSQEKANLTSPTVGKQSATPSISEPSVSTSGISESDSKAAVERFRSLKSKWQGNDGTTEAAKQLLESSPQHITDGGQQVMHIMQAAETLGASVLVDFSASWCGPCRAMKSVLVQLAEEFRGRVCILMIDCEATNANKELARDAAISAFPAFHIYQGRSRKQSFQGGKALPAFRALLNEHLSAFPLKASSDNKTRMEGVVEALGKVHSNASPPVFEQFCRLLQKILENIRDHPEEQKFRSLKASNARIQQGVLAVSYSRDVLTNVGFFSLMEAGVEVFYGTSVQLGTATEVVRLLQEARQHPQALGEFVASLKGDQVKVSDDAAPVGAASSSQADPLAVKLAQQLAQIFASSSGQHQR